MSFIAIKSVTKSYGGRQILHDFSFQADKGDRIAILGPSGCGKTTVLRLLAGFIAPDSGSISIEGDLVAADGTIIKDPEERNLGMVFQDLALWPHLTVRGNLEFGLKAKGIVKAKREQLIQEILSLVQMEEYIHAKPGELSGGQQQRVALARALVLHPKTLLMDEPLSNLDFELNQRLRKEILRFQKALGFTLIYVTHDRDEALDIGTRILLMRGGKVERSGPAEEFRASFNS